MGGSKNIKTFEGERDGFGLDSGESLEMGSRETERSRLGEREGGEGIKVSRGILEDQSVNDDTRNAGVWGALD